MNENTLSILALKMVPNIGDIQARILLDYFGDAAAVFKAPKQTIEKLPGIGTIRASNIKSFKGFDLAEQYLIQTQQQHIQVVTMADQHYPKRLAQCADAPVFFFYKGNTNLNAAKIISVIGTRNNSAYGRDVTVSIIEGLKNQDITVVSGLAYGIDTISHQSSIKCNLPTVGVLAHGFQQIYPATNTQLAQQMISNGGLITEFLWGVGPDRQNFPKRNRIVAGLSDATLVVETSEKGGSMITAEMANGYNRDVFAVPGRVNDSKSLGCNKLIKQNKAALVQTAEDIIYMMGWDAPPTSTQPRQRALFQNLSDEENTVVQVLEKNDTVHIDDLHLKCNLPKSILAGILLNLELLGVIRQFPGSRYGLI